MNHPKTFTHSVIALLIVGAITLFNGNCARAQNCPLSPIALSLQSLTGVAEGTIITNIYNGTQPGNFGWLSWTSDPDEPTLITSLAQPGDSYTYNNPDNSADHQLNVGDWVSGKPGVSNGKHVRAALDILKGVTIIVPVWDQVRGQGENSAYHIVKFAFVQIISYQLPSQNRITAQFLGYVDCGDLPQG